MSRQFKILVRHLNFYYGDVQALKDINLEIPPHHVTALIGPSGCGKTTFLRCLNRMNDTIEGIRTEGEILLDGTNICSREVDPVRSGGESEWFFKNRTRFPKPSLKTWLMV